VPLGLGIHEGSYVGGIELKDEEKASNLSDSSKGSDSRIEGWGNVRVGEEKWGGVSLTKCGEWSKRVRGRAPVREYESLSHQSCCAGSSLPQAAPTATLQFADSDPQNNFRLLPSESPTALLASSP
jgi:hypothetical protein